MTHVTMNTICIFKQIALHLIRVIHFTIRQASKARHLSKVCFVIN